MLYTCDLECPTGFVRTIVAAGNPPSALRAFLGNWDNVQLFPASRYENRRLEIRPVWEANGKAEGGEIDRYVVYRVDNTLVAKTFLTPGDLDGDTAKAVLARIVDEMYHDGPDTAWNVDTIGEVADILAQYDLVPLGEE